MLLSFRLCRGAWPAAAPVTASFCLAVLPHPVPYCSKPAHMLLPVSLQDLEQDVEVPHRLDEASALQGWPQGPAQLAVQSGLLQASLLGGEPLLLLEQEALMCCCVPSLPWRLCSRGQPVGGPLPTSMSMCAQKQLCRAARQRQAGTFGPLCACSQWFARCRGPGRLRGEALTQHHRSVENPPEASVCAAAALNRLDIQPQ
jgi:hypothetical protein